MSYSHITELIKKWEEYENLYPDTSLQGFGQWLSSAEGEQSNFQNVLKKKKDFLKKWDSYEEGLKFQQQHENTAQIGILIGRLSKFGRIYAKKMLAPLNLNLDEFSFLASIFHMDSPKKTDVIHINLFEPTSGTEILRRLIKLGYVKEQTNKQDKRSKTLKLTSLGEKTAYKAFEAMHNVGVLVSANLSEEQRNELASIMNYLNDFHVNLYLNHKEENVEEMIRRYIQK